MNNAFNLEFSENGNYICKRYITVDEYSIVNNGFVTIEFLECDGMIELLLENGDKYKLLSNHTLANLTEHKFKVRVNKNSKLNITFSNEKKQELIAENIHTLSNGNKELAYKVEGNTLNPQKILLTFPSNSSCVESTCRLHNIDRSDLLDIQIIDEERNWLLDKDDIILELVTKVCHRYELEQKDFTLSGSGKGGALTLKFGKLLPDAKKIAITPIISKEQFLNLNIQSDNVDIPMYYLKETTICKEIPDHNTIIITNEDNYNEFSNTIKVKTISTDVVEASITAEKLGAKYASFLINESLGNTVSRNYVNTETYVSNKIFKKDLSMNEDQLLAALNIIEVYNENYHDKYIVEYVSRSNQIALDLSNLRISEHDNVSHGLILKSREKLITNSYKHVNSVVNAAYYKVDKSYKYVNISVIKGHNYGKNILLESGELDILGVKDRESDVLKNSKFYSIPTKHIKGILSNLGIFDITYSDEIIFTEEQKAFNMRHNVQCDVIDGIPIYFTENNVQKPQKLIFTFAGVHAANNVPYVMSAMSSFKSKMEGIKIIALMDVNEYLGKYLSKYNGKIMKPTVEKFIQYYIEKYNVDAEQTFFYGNSKGASTAIQFIDSYPNSKFILDIPQMSISAFIKPRPKLQQVIFGEVGFEYIDYFKKMKNVNVYYTFAEFDDINTCDEFDFDGINTCLAIGADHGSIGKIVPKSVELVVNSCISIEDFKHDGVSDIIIEEEDCIAIEICRYNPISKVYSSILLEKNENKFTCEYDKYKKYLLEKLTDVEQLKIRMYK